MSSAYRYNSLGQILAAGGEISLGLMVASGESKQSVFVAIARRYPDLPQSDYESLYEYAVAGYESAQLINELGPGGSMDISQIPVQRLLFGNEAQGRRLMIAGVATNQDTGQKINIRYEAFDFSGLDDLFRQIGEWIANTAQSCPAFAQRIGLSSEQVGNFVAQFAERRF